MVLAGRIRGSFLLLNDVTHHAPPCLSRPFLKWLYLLAWLKKRFWLFRLFLSTQLNLSWVFWLQPVPRNERGGPNVLVLSPTRELALQVSFKAGL